MKIVDTMVRRFMSIMTNYISTISSIDDALEDLEEELLTITDENDIGIRLKR